MNPILKLLNPQKSKGSQSQNPPAELSNLISGMKTGKIDPKKKAISFLEEMTPQQRVALKQLMPQIVKLGSILGVSKKNIERFNSEIQRYLT